jgi:putative hydrolase of the HAD superfamily
MHQMKYSVIGFDADDTLWVNETYYRETEIMYFDLMKDYINEKDLSSELYKTEMENLKIYGYGTKGFMLSMIETALKVSNKKVSQKKIHTIIQAGKEMLNKPVILLDGVRETLKHLNEKGQTLIVASKGDLTDQERKLEASGILHYFDHTEIMSDKKEDDYNKLLNRLHIKPAEFLMIGNSLKSDILPVLNIGANAIHIPFHTTWHHEVMADRSVQKEYIELKNISEIINYIDV